MTIASLILALVVTSAADTSSGDPILYDFHASWCGPCQTMRPEVDKLVRRNYPIKSVDIDKNRGLAEQFQVEKVPTFIVADREGHVLARTMGVLPAADLAKFYNNATTRAEATAGREVHAEAESADAEDSAADAAPPTKATGRANPLPWETVVRIKMHLSSSQMGLGSGTIIYSDPDQSIILTCAHIFKGARQELTPLKDFRTKITVDLFDGKITDYRRPQLNCVEQGIVGEALDYDYTNDVGLIRIRPGRVLPASKVVPETWKPRPGMNMYSVGCSHGEDATAFDTQIIDPSVKMMVGNKSFYEMKCRIQPKEGRSGGGLYTTNGYVAGVCDFADPNDHVGLYAVPTAIHRLLDRNQMTALYKANDSGRMLAANPRGTRVRAQSDDEPAPTEARNFTIPGPERFQINTPETRVASAAGRSDAWSNPGLEGAGRSTRVSRRPDREGSFPGDPGPHPAGTALATESAQQPSSESLMLDMPEIPTPGDRTEPAPAAAPATSGKWRGVHSTARPGSNRD